MRTVVEFPDAATLTVPLTVAPAAGAVMVAEGGGAEFPPAYASRSLIDPLKRSRSMLLTGTPLTVPVAVYCQNFQLAQAAGTDGHVTCQFAIQRSAVTVGSESPFQKDGPV